MIKHRLLTSIYVLLLVTVYTSPAFSQASNPHNTTNLVSQYIRSIYHDSKGNFWFGPAGSSVIRYDGKTLRYYTRTEFYTGDNGIQDTDVSVHAITEDKKGNIWFGTYHGVVKYDGSSFKSYTEKDGLANLKVGRSSIVADRSGNIWIGTTTGVYRYNESEDLKGARSFTLFDKLPEIYSTGIIEDRNGNIWFASEKDGVFRYDGKTVKNLSEKEGLSNNYAGGITEDTDGNLWFVMNSGVVKYDGTSFKEITFKDGIGGTEVWGVFAEKSGIIWIAGRGATTKYDPSVPISDPKAFAVYTPNEGLNCCVQSMHQDRAGRMWWGSGAGLYRFDGKNFYQVTKDGPW